MAYSTKEPFITIAERHIDDSRALVAIGQRAPSLIRDLNQRLNCYLRPFFGQMRVQAVGHRELKAFTTYLAERGLSSSSILCVMSLVSQTLKLAAQEGLISHVPVIPRPRQVDSPRHHFTADEMHQLYHATRRAERGQPTISFKGNILDREMRHVIAFMEATFCRPADVFKVQHRHVQVKASAAGGYLLIATPPTKRHHTPTVSMPNAVVIYERQLAAQRAKGLGGPDDYVFLPHIKNRAYAQEIISRQFTQLLAAAGLQKTTAGEPRTLYSIRHYAITSRLLKSDGLDLITLAKNCRTSPEMISRFYASWLQPEQNVALIQSFRPGARFT